MSSSKSSSLGSTLTVLTELPNLPGIRRDISSANPKLYKEFKKASTHQQPSLFEDKEFADDEESLGSFFENSRTLSDLSVSLSAFPTSAVAYNDPSGRYSLKSQKMDRLSKSRSLPYTSLDNAPSFVANNCRTCHFLGCFDEETPENLLETFRTRKVEIIFYTENEEIEIIEPNEKNSGINQGKILKKHQIMKENKAIFTKKLSPVSPTKMSYPSSPASKSPAQSLSPSTTKGLNVSMGSDGTFRELSEKPYFSLSDFYSGAELRIYGRTYFILDCDRSTRSYFEDEMGQPFGPAIPLPNSYYLPGSRRPKPVISANRKPPNNNFRELSKSHKAELFFTFDRKTLRFVALWDNRGELFGDKRFVKVHFSLADLKFEVIPLSERNSGCDKLNVLLKKCVLLKLPDQADGSNAAPSDQSYVSANSSLTNSQSPVPTTLTLNPEPQNPRPYNWQDLSIGLAIKIASASLYFIDADEFTREFYVAKGCPLADPIRIDMDVHPGVNKILDNRKIAIENADPLALPPSDTFLPYAPPKDGAKAKLFLGMILRFQAKLDHPTPADVSRRFIIQVRLEDDSIQIIEPPQRNSGHQGGIFLTRDRIQNKDKNRYMIPQDFYVGCNIGILAHRFIILDADEYTLKYMSQNPDQWVYCDINHIMRKLKAKEEILKKKILTTGGLTSQVLNYDNVFDLLVECNIDLVKHEAITLCRELDPTHSGSIKLTKLLKYCMRN